MQRWHRYRSVSKWEVTLYFSFFLLSCALCMAVVVAVCFLADKSFAFVLIPFGVLALFSRRLYSDAKETYQKQEK